MTSSRTWGGFFEPYCGGGGRWRPFRFRSPSWMTSFAGTGNEVIQDGDRKRKGRHLAPPPQWGSKKPPYTTSAFTDRKPHIDAIIDIYLMNLNPIITWYVYRATFWWQIQNKYDICAWYIIVMGYNHRYVIYELLNLVSIGSGNGLSPVQRHATTCAMPYIQISVQIMTCNGMYSFIYNIYILLNLVSIGSGYSLSPVQSYVTTYAMAYNQLSIQIMTCNGM